MINSNPEMNHITTARGLADHILKLGKKNGFVPETETSFLEAYRKNPRFFNQVCETQEMIRFVHMRKDAVWLMNNLFR